ncbi:MAG: bifunctional 23S rRNA (guanine(2069)-N(7))-methyltransferase RlmK/23S rRNA (guanine(2445)-N(2))-methyltransferase RlmL [Spongiibacteraceae bacterium]|nr:bifunctional 23S rRNA (guanine(2069)-N(7))-methyltransferase RlmK/23S rRNA (guanine(2445)-N(2))-methyltransferase RlmL [Spongiibacteraceae bacterium]
MPNPPPFFATCPKGLESLLLNELQHLGAVTVKETVAGVYFTGPLALGYRCCLWSRLANKILMPLATVTCRNTQDLYQGVKDLPWEEHLALEGTFCIDFSGKLADVTHSHFGALKAKDAIADYFTEREGRRPNVDADKPDVRVNVRVSKGQMTVAIDLSGESLHRRGYRQRGGAAPLKENLAAALLLRSDWPGIAAKGGALLDPMCGSGTLLIEAALMSANIAPGLDRLYWGFDGWLGHQPSVWHELIEEAESARDTALAKQWPLICGYDNSPKAIQLARDNIDLAGLTEQIKVSCKEVNRLVKPTHIPVDTGLCITNPPYGERLGDINSLVHLYRDLGERLKKEFVGWQAGVFTGNVDLGKKIGLHSRKQYQLFNGAIPSKLLMFDIEPENFIRPSTQAFLEKEDQPEQAPLSEGAQMFANRLRKNRKKLAKWIKQNTIEAYRLYDADMPEYCVAIDCYKDWVHVAEYAPPAKVDADAAQHRLSELMSAIPSALDVSPDKVVLKQRRRQKGRQQYERHTRSGDFFEVREGEAKLLVNMKDYLDTGLFLDHRPIRLEMPALCQGKRFLNLFSYTGAVSVQAALGGATLADSVDLSQTYLDWARKNLVLNGLDEQRNSLIRADAREWLKQTVNHYDVIFLDPPTFSNSKKMEGVLDIQRDHVELINDAMDRLVPGGMLIFSTNQRRFVLDKQALADFSLEDKTQWSIDKDFSRSSHIHQCWFIRY